jgi:hypothetical protein
MRLNEEGESVVVVPSVTVDRVGEGSGSLMQAYEERFLFLLLLLREPRLRMVYVTSTPIAPSIIEYYLALLPAVIPSHARALGTKAAAAGSSPRRACATRWASRTCTASTRWSTPSLGCGPPAPGRTRRSSSSTRASPAAAMRCRSSWTAGPRLGE